MWANIYSWLTSMPSIPWWAASLVANATICRTEYLNRTLPVDTFADALPHTWWLILLAQWGLWNAWNGAPSMLTAWVCFTTMNSILRLGNSHFAAGEPISLLSAGGSALMFLAAWMVKEGSVASS